MDSGHFWKIVPRGLNWLFRFGRIKERRIKDDSKFLCLSNCVNYTRGSQIFSVHGTLSAWIFHSVPQGQRKSVHFTHWTHSSNLINICVTLLCHNLIHRNWKKNNTFISFLNSHDDLLMGCVSIEHFTASPIGEPYCTWPPSFPIHTVFCMVLAFLSQQLPKTRFCKMCCHWRNTVF